MPSVDPVILQLRADVDSYNANVSRAQKLTDQKLGAIEARGFAMGQGLKKSFDFAKGAAISYASTVGVGLVINAIKGALDHASALGEQAQALGISTDALQEYRFAGSQAGLAIEETDQLIAQLTRRIGEAADGTGAQADAFKRLGIDVRDANGNLLNAADAIPLIAEGLKKIPDPAEQATLKVDLMGRAGQKAGALLSGGAKGVNDLREELRSIGGVISEENINKADKLADSLGKLKTRVEAKLANSVGENAETIQSLANAIERLIDLLLQADRAYGQFQRSIKEFSARGKTVVGLTEGVRAEGRRELRELGVGGAAPRSAPAAMRSNGALLRASPKSGAFNPGLGPLKSNFAGESGNPFGSPGANQAGALALLAMAPAEAVAIVKAITAELEQLDADIATARARLSGNLEEAAEAEKKNIDARLRSEIERLEADAKESGVSNDALIAREKVLAELEKQAVAQGLATNLAERATDLAEQAVRAAEQAERDRLAARGPGEVFLDELKEDAGNLADQYEEIAVRGLGRIEDSLTRTVTKAFGLHGVLGDIVGDLVQMFIRFQVVLPLAEKLFGAGAGGGGGIGGLLGSIGSIFGSVGGGFGGNTPQGGGGGFRLSGARASGGPVSAGGAYLVGERGPAVLGLGSQGGFVMPNTALTAARGQQQGGIALVRLELSGDIDARIQRVSGPVAIEVVRASAPAVIDAAARETLSRAGRPRI